MASLLSSISVPSHQLLKHYAVQEMSEYIIDSLDNELGCLHHYRKDANTTE